MLSNDGKRERVVEVREHPVLIEIEDTGDDGYEFGTQLPRIWWEADPTLTRNHEPHRIRTTGTLYVMQPGVSVSMSAGKLVISQSSQVVREIPMSVVHAVVSGTHVNWTAAARSVLAKEGVPFTCVTHAGAFVYRSHGPVATNIELRHTQHLLVEDTASMLTLAKAFVKGKLVNMRVMMLRRDRVYGIRSSLDEHRVMDRAIRSVDNAGDVRQLLGYEGAGSQAYFARFSHWVKPPFSFERRERPAADPINAMLNYGYTLLSANLTNAIERVGLEPYQGFLHKTRSRRPALALDLMEEFRQIVVDAVVLQLVNQGQVRAADFSVNKDGACRMNDNCRSLFHRSYDRRLQQEWHSSEVGKGLTYERWMDFQVRQFAQVIAGQRDAYVPIRVR